MSLKITAEAGIAVVSATTALVDAGNEGSAQIIVWSGEVPVSADDSVSPTSVPLVTFDLPQPAFGAPAKIGNAIEALAFQLPAVAATGAGEASFFRVYDRDGNAVMQGEVSEEGEEFAAPLVVNQRTITEGAEIEVQSLVVGISLG